MPDTLMRSLSAIGKLAGAKEPIMVRAVPNHLIAALIAAALIGLAGPAMAQGLGIDLGGLGSVDVDLDSGIDVDVNVGGDNGLDVGLGIGGEEGEGAGDSTGLDLAPEGLALGQQAASTAVKNGRALPLEEILLRAKLITDGDIIDAQLIAVQDVLLYELKVLGKAGDVSELYFYARSGLPVETN